MYNGKKLLIVDDSKVERQILKEIGLLLNFEIFEAETAVEGLAKAEEIIPDLVLMDVVMPGMNGFQATKQLSLNENLNKIPVIMCTSKNQAVDKVWGMRQGAKDYIIKPVDKNELIEKIKVLLG
jgi:twitching motility two-component system response regulator PilH